MFSRDTDQANGQRHPIRLGIVSWETASHLAVPMWDQVREESRRAYFKEIKNTVQLCDDHGENENEIQKTSVEGRSTVRAMDFS